MARPEYQALAQYLGDIPVTDYVRTCWDVAEALVDKYLDGHAAPVSVLTRATTETAAELYHRRNAPNGVANWGDLDSGTVIRVARDALVAARPLLDPWKKPVFA